MQEQRSPVMSLEVWRTYTGLYPLRCQKLNSCCVSPKEVPRYCRASGGLSPRFSSRGGREERGARVSSCRAAEAPLAEAGVVGFAAPVLPLVLAWWLDSARDSARPLSCEGAVASSIERSVSSF